MNLYLSTVVFFSPTECSDIAEIMVCVTVVVMERKVCKSKRSTSYDIIWYITYVVQNKKCVCLVSYFGSLWFVKVIIIRE